jgi:hypothetical protein
MFTVVPPPPPHRSDYVRPELVFLVATFLPSRTHGWSRVWGHSCSCDFCTGTEHRQVTEEGRAVGHQISREPQEQTRSSTW